MEENTEVADAVVETAETTETPETVAPSSETKTSSDDHFDVFQWANNVDEIKNNVSVELFLFNKNYAPYKVRYSEGLTQTVKAMFMLEAVDFIVKEQTIRMAQRPQKNVQTNWIVIAADI